MDFEKITKTIDDFFGGINNTFMRFIGMWILNSILIIVPFEFLGNIIPTRFSWIKDQFIPLSIILGLAIAVIASLSKPSYDDAKKLNAILSGIFMIIIVIFILFSGAFPDQQNQIQVIKETLASNGFNETQIKIIDQILEKKGVVTFGDLKSMGLNEVQIQQLLDLLTKFEYVKSQDVITIIKTYESDKAIQAANMTATATLGTCYVELEPHYSVLTVVKLPIENSAVVGYMTRGERLIAKGHNGGTLNQDRMWLVILFEGESPLYGWIPSYAAVEINEPACVKLPKWPGS